MQDQDKTKEQLVEELADLRQRVAQLQRFCGDLDAFAYTVAHDLKHPLSLVIGYSDLLIDGYETMPKEELAECLQTVDQAAQKMNDSINELMLLVHVRDERRVEITPLDMGSVVAEALARLDYLVKRRRVKITQPTQWPKALGYAPWVEEVWYAFIGEILRFDASPLHIDIGASEEKGNVARFWVQVSDRGFTAEQQARLGQIIGGFKSDLVRRILKNLGGTFGAAGDIGYGGELYFTLPSKG
jgi:light-regulated signal transduction histidine kinase (bacteriophytochrome)